MGTCVVDEVVDFTLVKSTDAGRRASRLTLADDRAEPSLPLRTVKNNPPAEIPSSDAHFHSHLSSSPFLSNVDPLMNVRRLVVASINTNKCPPTLV